MTINKTSKVSEINAQFINLQDLIKNKWFRDYEDLYKNIVGFPLPKEKPMNQRRFSFYSEEPKLSQEEIDYLSSIHNFRQKLKDMQDEHRALYKNFETGRFFLNCDSHWTYVETCFGIERPGYKEFVKIYVPSPYKELSNIADQIFNYLYSQKKAFCFKIAHKYRKDNICLWVLPEMIEAILEFFSTIKSQILCAPLFCPEYKNFGVSRELSLSYNEAIASTLWRYLKITNKPDLSDYILFLEDEEKSNSAKKNLIAQHFTYYNKFDRTVVLNSLKCILYIKCPIRSEYNIMDIIDDRYHF